MLPFLKPKQVAGLIISHRKPDGGVGEEHSAGDENHALEAAAEDLLRAINSKDSKHFALALRAAYDILMSEEPKEDDNSFDAQNEKAANQE